MKRLQSLARAGHRFNNLIAIAARTFHFVNVTKLQLVHALPDVLARDTLTSQRLFHDLQIRHARDDQARQATGRAKDFLQHWHGVVFESAEAPATHQRAVKIPEEDAHKRALN